MSVVLIIVLWVAGVVILAGRGLKTTWLAGLLSFPLACALLFVLDPSLRAPDYRGVALTVAGLVWGMIAVASVAAWFIGARIRRPAASKTETR